MESIFRHRRSTLKVILLRDTAGLMDLLLPSKESVQQFVRDCTSMTPFDIRARMVDKKDVKLGLEKLVARPVTDAEKIAFMRFKWEYFSNTSATLVTRSMKVLVAYLLQK